MHMNVKISAKLYEEMRKYPLFFVKLYGKISYDEQGIGHDYSEWYSVDRNLGIRFPAAKFGQANLGYCLCIIEKAEFAIDVNGKVDKEFVYMHFHDASNINEIDYRTILNFCLMRSNDTEDKYAFVELLWFLDKYEINQKALSNAIFCYDSRYFPFILNIFTHICRCLSIGKQQCIKNVFESKGYQYNVYMPSLITEAIKISIPSYNIKNRNIFEIVDEIVGNKSSSLNEMERNSNNKLLLLNNWLHSESPLNNYNILPRIFSVVSEPTRLEIVRRYFHDIRLGNTMFDSNIISQFKDNKYDDFVRYRYAIETPTDSVVLTVPLLCDNILTLINSQGDTFQTFDGILDFAMVHSDKVHPSINFGLNCFIPTCEKGAVFNNEFKGFVDYQLICKIDDGKLTDSNLKNCICAILDEYGKRESFAICKYGDGSIMDKEQYIKCSQTISSSKMNGFTLDCFTLKAYNDRWHIDGNETNTEIINSFLANEIAVKGKNAKIRINLSQVSLDKFRKYIQHIPSSFTELQNGEFVVNSYRRSQRTYRLELVEKFSKILRMRLFPQKGAFVGFDVFGFWKEIKRTLTPEQLRNEKSPEFKAAFDSYLTKEKGEVYKRTLNSLKKEFGSLDKTNSYVEAAFDRARLIKLINKFYWKGTFCDNDDSSKHKFLTTSYITSRFKPFCAPKLSETKNIAIELPFFWCRGKECFHNNLEGQTLSETSDWHNYSLFHLIEIIGFPRLHKTEAGNEPDPAIWNFIAITNKAMQKFRRLKCRSCGHLMFTDKSSGFNRHNYYSCINPTCPECGKPVYLNYCYKCKKGLIDSRDTTQCPNGWYICPTCLSCCDDAQYDRLAQRYILSNSPVPDRIKNKLGHGHNDKGVYYCPHCGSKIEIQKNEHGDTIKYCQVCHTTFDDNINY